LLLKCDKGPYGGAFDDSKTFLDAADVVQEQDGDLKINPIWHPYHIWNNIFYTTEDNTQWKMCSGGEDQKCADQYSVLVCNVDDHLSYIGVKMGQCAIKNQLWSSTSPSVLSQ